MTSMTPLKSLWHLTAPPFPATSSLTIDTADTVVVGAGLTGITTALLLARSGQRVILVEACRAGAVTTGNTTGKLSLLQADLLSEIEDTSGETALQAYLEANREGQAWLTRELTRIGTEVREAPAFTYSTTSAARETIEREYSVSRKAGLDVVMTSETGLPYETTAAIRLSNQILLHPMEVLSSLAAEFIERGGAIVEQCRVTGFSEEGSGVSIETNQGNISADALVLATGTPILDRLFFSTKIVPSRSYAAAYRVPSAKIPQGMYVSVDTPTRSLRPAVGADGVPVLVVGGDSHTTGRTDPTSTSITELDDWTAKHFGAGERIAAWGAQDYRLSGGVPYYGPVPGSERVYAATGFNKWGMTNGVAAAHAIASYILGEPRGWAETLIEQVGSAPETLQTVSSVAGHLVKDWLAAETTSSSAADDLEEGDGVVVNEGMAPVAVSRVKGQTCRVSGVCTHLGGVLDWNDAEQSWDCPLHGSRFSPTGEVLEGPAVAPLSPRRGSINNSDD